MARIPDHEVERLKREVSLVRLVEAAGIEQRGTDHGFRDKSEPFPSPPETPCRAVPVWLYRTFYFISSRADSTTKCNAVE
jgi:hypothetical protein